MNATTQFVIYGAGGHARVIRDIAVALGADEFIGFVVEDNAVSGDDHCISERELTALDCRRGVVGIGDNQRRLEVVKKVSETMPDFQFITLVDPRCARQSDVEIGCGSVVMPGVSLNTGTRIGRHCIVNMQAAIDHDCVLDDFSSVAPGATLGGHVRVGSQSAISLGANLIHGVSIGAHTVIGAGATVVNDIGRGLVAVGTPCRKLRERAIGEPYF
jgi:sugar O-acyltransferase (sialic acid O-acetyltransferase NeuD family)